MNYLSVENLTKSFGERVLFENISFGIEKGQKTALVARNGSGKTTLMRIIMGLDVSDSGETAFHNSISVGFLNQVPVFDEAKTVMETIFTAKNPMVQAVKEYELALEEAQSGTEKSIERLQKASAVMDDLKAWDFETELKRTLAKLNITNLQQVVSQLSGGQRKRVALAKVIIENPDLLILDEPTNHLDVEMIEWLEDYLSRANISLFLVTHDRYFLDRICTHIIELENNQIYKYEGNYEHYLLKKEEREALAISSAEKARNLMKKELEWMRRMPKARGTKAKYRIDNFYELEKKAKHPHQQKDLKLDVQMSRMGSKILELKGIDKKFGDLTILNGFEYVFKKKERVGIVGKNGVGKSTFLNIIMGLENADAGEVITGETVVFGYYNQQGLQLPEDKIILDVVKDIAEVIPIGKKGETLSASQFLNLFLFPPKMQQTPVSKLSGGEKRRLHLLTILVKNPNFLILDEPTNDLDLQTLQTLEQFLDNFQGCVIVVTHDRYFMDRIVDHLFVFEGAGKIKDFNGKYTDYRTWKQEEEREAKKLEKAAKPKETSHRATQEKKKLSYKEKLEYEQLEGEIEALEEEKAQLEEKLTSGETDHQKLQEWSERIAELIDLIDEKTIRWMELAEYA
ncbi:MAG: ABC-F family ATP-binding cassette domain-containing protein [Flammeovirgaceae bacterium]